MARQTGGSGAFVRCMENAAGATEDVRDGAELKKNDPALLLKNYLQMAAISARTVKSACRQEAVTAREMYVKCLHAWNASRSGTKTNLRYLPDAPIPKLV